LCDGRFAYIVIISDNFHALALKCVVSFMIQRSYSSVYRMTDILTVVTAYHKIK